MAIDVKPEAPPAGRIPVLAPGHTLATVTDQISDVVLKRPVTYGWVLGFAISFILLNGLLASVVMLMTFGVGVWGINQPVGWGFAIVNFVWWIGIGHAGTLISAILLLMRQQWRTSINRFAEAMTLFAVACAGLFPLLHMGRPWFFYWLLPYPNVMELWPQFRSPLVWDVFAVSTYATMSLVFWYVGLIPDLATLRDRTKYKVLQVIFGIVALGWRNSVRHWHRYEVAYLILAGLATPLVVSVHTVVSFDFAVGIIPGWHVTIFPPYFVAGAIYAGFAMVLTLCIPVRYFYNLQDFITTRHLQTMAKVTLATGLMVAYGYAIEAFGSFYSTNQYEAFLQKNRMLGPYFYIYWSLILCNVLVPQFLWFSKFRTHPGLLFIVAMFVNMGMWLERYVIVITSLHRDFMPSAWGMYSGTIWDYATLYGSIGLFATLIFLFIRVLPAISIFEMRALVAETDAEKAHAVHRSGHDAPFARHESPKETVS
jgi:Ni/Fe-hydrogenase subunit HybB-like protein